MLHDVAHRRRTHDEEGFFREACHFFGHNIGEQHPQEWRIGMEKVIPLL